MNADEKTIYANGGEAVAHADANGESTWYVGRNGAMPEKPVSPGSAGYDGADPMSEFDDIDHAVFCLPVNTILQRRYRIDTVLGEGGFGITYRGWDITLNAPVAIKEYYPRGLVTRSIMVMETTQVVPISQDRYGQQFREGIEQVLEEARRMALFRSTPVPGIVSVYDFFRENNTAYIVMEYVDGCTLGAYWKNQRLDSTSLFHFLVPVMDALQILHSQGIIHRDVSPDNIMVDGSGSFKLLDFGAARGYSEDRTLTMTVVLKKAYAPEEQYREKGHQGPWTDVYAMGATIYELITGRTPPGSLDRLVKDEIVDIQELAPSLTRQQAAAIMKALAVRAENRWQSMDEFKRALLLPTGEERPEKKKAIALKPGVSRTTGMVSGTDEIRKPAAIIATVLFATALFFVIRGTRMMTNPAFTDYAFWVMHGIWMIAVPLAGKKLKYLIIPAVASIAALFLMAGVEAEGVTGPGGIIIVFIAIAVYCIPFVLYIVLVLLNNTPRCIVTVIDLILGIIMEIFIFALILENKKTMESDDLLVLTSLILFSLGHIVLLTGIFVAALMKRRNPNPTSQIPHR